jgi:hypothetical protein
MCGRFIYFLFGLFFFISIYPQETFAHPGGTSKDGCHYCRSRCDYWGVPWNKRHCHGGLKQEEIKTISQIDKSSIAPLNHPSGTTIPGCHGKAETGAYHCH